MKPFTFLFIVAAIIVGLWTARCWYVCGPEFEDQATATVVLQTEPVPAERDFGPDGDDGDDDNNGREVAEGLPVPIVPGTRVSEARIETPPARIAMPPALASATATLRSISGRLSASEGRARDDARLQLDREVTEWLAPDVPTQWKPPSHLITRMIRRTEVHPIVKDYGTVYEAIVQADFSSPSRALLVGAHQRQVVGRRLVVLGGSLGFVLACLGSLAGYIRADEATKGYYTGWLRAIATAGVGAAGVVLYQLLT
jgi:hypothetical protein